MPIIRSLSTAVAAPGLPLERGGSSTVGRGRSDRPTTINSTATIFSFLELAYHKLGNYPLLILWYSPSVG